jgi:hypothetical protein
MKFHCLALLEVLWFMVKLPPKSADYCISVFLFHCDIFSYFLSFFVLVVVKSVACNSQLGSPWRGKIHHDQPLLQQHTTAATFDIAAGTAGLAQHL